MRRACAGAVAGFLATLTMSGAAITVRRVTSPSTPVGETHYERVGVALVAMAKGAAPRDALADPDQVLTAGTRRRVGEALHLAFGSMNGTVLAVLRPGPGRPSGRDGLALGAGLWLAAFVGYLPRIGVTTGVGSMSTHERLRTLATHLIYGGTSALLTTALLERRGSTTDDHRQAMT